MVNSLTVHGPRALLIGCHGGVGRAVLGLLEHTAPGREILNSLDGLILVDEAESSTSVGVGDSVLLPPMRVNSAGDLARLIRAHRITQVIALASTDTVDCARVCDELGADLLCASVEEWPGRGSLSTDSAIARLLPPRRPILKRQSHLIGSGANPGIVNALAFTALDEFASRAGVEPTIEDLDLYAILITEEDTTTEQDAAHSTEIFPMSWSPTQCLEELFEPSAFIARNGKMAGLGHPPNELCYRARCGDRLIEGMAVPHEEIATLARYFPSLEIGFIYRIPAAARRALAAHPTRTRPGDWQTRQLCPPWVQHLAGKDRIGVLLCSRSHGELWTGFDTDMAIGLRIGTNATQLQVAAGVMAGWQQIGRRKGIHFVEDLDRHEFVMAASKVLGAPLVVHDEHAKPCTFVRRAVHTGQTQQCKWRGWGAAAGPSHQHSS
ncbi:MAG: hypothetical protein LC114_00430 [Bryobacterales bacterium]|nr:hypothetical protein [Bryobacterales bacterium]